MLQKMTQMQAPNDGGKAADPALTWQRVGDQFLSDVTAYLKANPVIMPYARPAADLLREMRGDLARFARLVVSAEGGQWPTHTTISHLSVYLIGRLDAVFRLEEVGKLTIALEDWTKRTAKAIDLPDDATRFAVGPCPQETDTDYCPGIVWLRVPQSSGWGQELPPPTMTCTACKMVWDSTQMNRAGRRIKAREEQIQQAQATAKETA
jgi:hypothetical protein